MPTCFAKADGPVGFPSARMASKAAHNLRSVSARFPVGSIFILYSIPGSVAKIGWGRKKPGPDFSLGGNLEEALHESYLSANVAFPDSFNLALPDHVRDLISADGPPS